MPTPGETESLAMENARPNPLRPFLLSLSISHPHLPPSLCLSPFSFSTNPQFLSIEVVSGLHYPHLPPSVSIIKPQNPLHSPLLSPMYSLHTSVSLSPLLFFLPSSGTWGEEIGNRGNDEAVVRLAPARHRMKVSTEPVANKKGMEARCDKEAEGVGEGEVGQCRNRREAMMGFGVSAPKPIFFPEKHRPNPWLGPSVAPLPATWFDKILFSPRLSVVPNLQQSWISLLSGQ